jgi:excisionase family DNA binding protein
VITAEGARLSSALAQVIDGLVELVAAGVVEKLRPQLGELVAVRGGAAPVPSEPPSRPGAPTDLLTITEAAKLLNVAKSTVKWWTYRSKVLPHVSLGPGPRKICRIRRADLDAFVADGPRGSAREQAIELLTASEERSQDRRRRRLEREDTRARKASTASTMLTRVCAGCKEARPLSAFAARGVTVSDRCDRCRRREPEPVVLKVIHQGEDPPPQPWGRRRAP